MATQPSVMIKNKLYDGTRLTIVGSHSSNQYLHYSEATGNRYYVNEITATQSNLESVTFNAYLSFTSSNTTAWEFNLIPMQPGTSCIINTKILGLKSDGTKGYLSSAFGGYRHSGSALTRIGGSFTYDTKSDFTGAQCYFTASGTASVLLYIQGTSEVIDWDVHIDYVKSYHTLASGSSGGSIENPWQPPNNPN